MYKSKLKCIVHCPFLTFANEIKLLNSMLGLILYLLCTYLVLTYIGSHIDKFSSRKKMYKYIGNKFTSGIFFCLIDYRNRYKVIEEGINKNLTLKILTALIFKFINYNKYIVDKS